MRDINLLTSNGVNIKKSLELFGDMETYDITLGDFLGAIDEKLNLLKLYRESGDMPNYAIQAHSLKTDAKYFGFERLAELSYQHELEGKANNVLFVYDHYEELINETNKMVNLVKRYLGDENASIPVVETPQVEQTPKEHAILVVDDSNIITSFIKKIFNDTFEVIEARDGNEAINYINNDGSSRIAGMLLDLNMPNVDGFQVLNYFQERGLFNKIPVSIITGENQKDPIERAFKYPIVDMLTKPFNERDVKNIVEKTIDFNKLG